MPQSMTTDASWWSSPVPRTRRSAPAWTSRRSPKGEAPITEQGFAGITKRDFPKPIIAAVNGSALAGGFEIMLSCDLVVAASHAKFGIPEAARGLIAGGGGLIRLAKRIPRAIALELALTAAPIDAERALAVGLVNRVVDGPQVLDRCGGAGRAGRVERARSRSR
jgi:enoyl-CoA hydratase/carnithine racemase